MIIQIVIRLIINTDQYITRIGTIIEGSGSQSTSNNTDVEDTSSTNSSYTEDARQIKGIDNTVSKLWLTSYKTFGNIDQQTMPFDSILIEILFIF